jgi:hypothetical protein
MAIEKQRMKIEMNDPAVDAALGSQQGGLYGRIERSRRMTPAQRKKAERDAARSKVTFDWPKTLIAAVNAEAERLGVPASQVAALLAMYALREAQAGRIDLLAHRRASTTPRFLCLLDLRLPEEAEGHK